MKKFSELPDLRDAVRAWYQEFAEEGPYDEDVAALVKYLRDVVMDEKDLAKAVAVIKWLEWVVEDGVESETADEAWGSAQARITEGVQAAARERGLGKVDFG